MYRSIAVIALGTRGDVQPLSLLSWQVQQELGDDGQVTLITHAAHQDWLLPLLGHQSTLKFLYLSSTPAAVWQHETGSSSSSTNDRFDSVGPSVTGSSSSRTAAVREELLQHCCTALNLRWQQQQQAVTSLQPQVDQSTDTVMLPPVKSQQQQQRLIIFNLFALEAYHISEALQVPCAVAQPYLIPYGMPSGFERRFKGAVPGLYSALKDADQDPSSGCVTWKDVCHWMWPLFTERWGAWRLEVLGLEPLPLLQAWQQGWKGCTYGSSSTSSSSGSSHEGPKLPAAVPVFYGLSPAVVTVPGYWPASVTLTGHWLVRDVHQSAAWQQQQQQRRGAVHPQQRGDTLEQQQQQQSDCHLPTGLQNFIDGCQHTRQSTPQLSDENNNQKMQAISTGQQDSTAAAAAAAAAAAGAAAAGAAAAAAAAGEGGGGCCDGLLLVDFGSMGSLGLLRDPDVLVTVIVTTLNLLNWCGILMSNGWQPLVDAYNNYIITQPQQQQSPTSPSPQPAGSPAAQQQQQQQRLYLQQQSLTCHHRLLDQIDVVLHHGGSGTVAATLGAGLPQIICPLQFDQFYWAERVSDLGCSPDQPVTLDRLLPQIAAAGSDEPHHHQQQAGRFTSRAGAFVSDTDTAAAAAAGTYLAALLVAARSASVVQTCKDMKQILQCENGLHAAADEVLSYLDNISKHD